MGECFGVLSSKRCHVSTQRVSAPDEVGVAALGQLLGLLDPLRGAVEVLREQVRLRSEDERSRQERVVAVPGQPHPLIDVPHRGVDITRFPPGAAQEQRIGAG